MVNPRKTFTCPRCEAEHDMRDYPGIPSEVPLPGDLSVCGMCAAPLRFEEHGNPTWLTLGEIKALPQEAVRAIIHAVMFVVTFRKGDVQLGA